MNVNLSNVIVPTVTTRGTPDGEVLARCKLEERIVAGLIQHMHGAGFVPYRVNDGESMTYCRTPWRVGGIEAAKLHAMNACFAVDESSLRFIPESMMRETDASTPDVRTRKGTAAEHGVLLVCGNGEDIISDWNYFSDDRDGFNAAMEAFDVDALL